MASSREARVRESGRGVNSQQKSSEPSVIPLSAESTDLGRQVEEYLTSIKQELSSNNNDRLIVEQAKILDLLDSYRKLSEVYNRKKDLEEKVAEKGNITVPEIYSVLYPELYQDKREREKDKLRRSLTKAKPSTDFCVPRNYRLQGRSDLLDVRQKEKERFIRLISSAPSSFLQGPPRRSTSRKLALSSSSASLHRSQDTREKEKERLAKILSTSERQRATSSKKPSSDQNTCRQLTAPNPSTARKDAIKSSNRAIRSQDNVEKSGMVRRDVPKRSFTSQSSDKQQERRKRLLDLKNRECQEYLDKLQGRMSHMSKVDKGVLAREASILDLTGDSVDSSPRSMVSVATQTDSSDLRSAPLTPTSPVPPSPNFRSSEESKLFPVQKEAFITSPRAKLIKDLHGVSPCLPGASPLLTLPDQAVLDEKKKRCAYAEALKAQINEKKRIEEEKRRKELEEDEYIEKKAREQQQRLKQEWEREQSLRQDWLMQKEAQEETVRQRMVELELEAKELKKRERLRRGNVMGLDGAGLTASVLANRQKVLSPREVEELLPQAMRDSMMSSIIMDKPRPKSLHLENNNNTLSSDKESGVCEGEPRVTDAINNNEGDNEEVSDIVTRAGDTQVQPPSDKDNTSPPDDVHNRPTSPVLPAVQTDSILRRSIYSSPRLQLIQGDSDKDEILRGDKILTQLGVFRRELELEQERLQQRLYEQAST